MAPIITDRLRELQRLRARIDQEIQAELLRAATDGGHTRPHDTTPAPARPAVPTAEEIAAAHGVTSLQVKEWGLSVGLIPEIRRGRLSLDLAKAYAAEHRPSTPPTSTGDIRP